RCYNGRMSLKEGLCSFWGLGLHPVRSGFSLHRGGGGGLRRDATAVVRTGLGRLAKAPQVYAAGYPGADFTAVIWPTWSIVCSQWNAIHSVAVSGPNTG